MEILAMADLHGHLPDIREYIDPNLPKELYTGISLTIENLHKH